MHQKLACRVHKGIVQQCRCPAPNKATRYVACDDRCPQYKGDSDEPGDRLPRQDR